ncbi:MAG: hypothetical protein M1825_000729 [Sarcosagium campestre]|nr:MAG: hypothetical protein M1825_000729 [Sarcosagium campestre]
MRSVEAFLVLASAAAVSTASDSPRPRGVGPDFAKYYKAADTFACILNPSIQLDPSQINDDYCDCPDGSDEPGTAACSFLSPLSPPSPAKGANVSVALPGFYCKNKGHRPSYLPFTNVNDGVCDYDICCDGSDEWERVGGASCEDRCKEIGKDWRKKDELRKKSLGAATKRRRELVADASSRRKALEDEISRTEAEIKTAEANVAQLEHDLVEVEKKERGKVVKGSKINVLAGLAKQRIEELRDSVQFVRAQRDASRAKVLELEKILSTFKEDYNPNFNDEGVKRAVRSWEEYAAAKEVERADEVDAEERDLDEIVKTDDAENGINWTEWEGESSESDVESLYQLEAYLPLPVRTWINEKLQALRTLLVENGILAPSSGKGDTPALSAARTALDTANTGLNSKRDSLSKAREDLDKDYGADDVFRGLKDQCVSKDSGEYTYEMCWMSRTTQKSKKGGGSTGMGNFVRIDKTYADDDLPADGRGLGSGERVALRYENGQHCWNGPARSTFVVLACAEKDEIWKVVEEEKCVYRMEVGTPAVCDIRATESEVEAGSQIRKDEL